MRKNWSAGQLVSRSAWVLLMSASILMAAPQESKKLPSGPGMKPFDVGRHTIPLEEIKPGGPSKDGIPSLAEPRFVSAREADKFLAAKDLVLGLERESVTKAYPIKILNWHEVVNDTIAGEPILVTW